jgi:hypothetical protein
VEADGPAMVVAGADVPANPVKLEFKGGDKMARILRQLDKRINSARGVKVGFLSNAEYPETYKNRLEHRISEKRGLRFVAQAAFLNEFGTKKTPSRPFFRTMIAECSPRWGDSMAYLVKVHKYDAKAVFVNMGQGIQGQLKQSIKNWSEPPNAPFTVEQKGFNKPLTDEGIMANSVDYEVAAK